MCLFFKKKSKLKAEDVCTVMADVLGGKNLPGFPNVEDRNDSNYKLETRVNGDICSASITGVVDGVEVSIKSTYSLGNPFLSFYLIFGNISFEKRFDEKKELKKKYPLYDFSFLEKNTWADKMQNIDGQRLRYWIKCKTLEEIADGVKDFIDEYAYINIYQTVIELNKGQKIGE
ncbi:MAG: hypothetical protein J6U92_03335 [Clostridia bacterium]|nr:hypothetical protein [Clostridia bacterium]